VKNCSFFGPLGISTSHEHGGSGHVGGSLVVREWLTADRSFYIPSHVTCRGPSTIACCSYCTGRDRDSRDQYGRDL